TKPVLIGPTTYLTLGKVADGSDTDKFALFDRLLPVYVDIVEKLVAAGAEWIQIDEPIFALDLNDTQRQLLTQTYAALGQIAGARILVANYFGELRDNLDTFATLPVAALHIDAVRGVAEVEAVAGKIGADTLLSVGVVDGRNVWK